MHTGDDQRFSEQEFLEMGDAIAQLATEIDVVDAGEDATSVRSPVETVIHISAEDFGGYTESGDGISAETSRRLLCDCGIVPMLEDVFVRPDGERVSAAPPRPVVSPTIGRPSSELNASHPSPPAPGWDGLPVDYEACVNSLGSRPAVSQSAAP